MELKKFETPAVEVSELEDILDQCIGQDYLGFVKSLLQIRHLLWLGFVMHHGSGLGKMMGFILLFTVCVFAKMTKEE